MTQISLTRIAAAAIGALVVVGVATGARADMRFQNLTDQSLHFSMTCNGTALDAWTITPHGSGAVDCTNGSSEAVVQILTSHGRYDEVVRAVVHDGYSYRLGYDRDGDVSIAPAS